MPHENEQTPLHLEKYIHFILMVFEATFQIVLKTLNNQPGDFVFELPLLIPAFIPKFTEWVLEMVLLTLLKLERVSDSLWVESSLVPSLNW